MIIIKITNIKSKESGLHYYNKGYLMDWIINKQVSFVDQRGSIFNININPLEFGSMESYVYKESGVMEPYESGQCWQCIKVDDIDNTEEDEEKYINKYHELFNERFLNDDNGEWNKNILYKDEDRMYFKTHPCNFCKFKGIADCILIFDIAFAHKGKIEIAIEVNKTSPVKKNKIIFCKENDITLIQVNAKDINKVTLRENKIIPCEIIYAPRYNYLSYEKDKQEDDYYENIYDKIRFIY